MKRTISILLLLVFAFNLGGYYLLFKALQVNAHSQLVQKLNNDEYSESQLIELRIPIHLPYPSFFDNTEYKRVDGKIKHKGNIYKLVKQKLERDMLIVLVINDNVEKQLVDHFQEFEKATQDHPISNKNQSAQTIKQLQKEYHSSDFEFAEIKSVVCSSYGHPVDENTLITLQQDIPTPPPQS